MNNNGCYTWIKNQDADSSKIIDQWRILVITKIPAKRIQHGRTVWKYPVGNKLP